MGIAQHLTEGGLKAPRATPALAFLKVDCEGCEHQARCSTRRTHARQCAHRAAH